MYTPQHFRFGSNDEMVAFMKEYSFATIVTNKGDVPVATQLPFSVNHDSGKIVLTSHFAIANEQAKYIETHTSLVIFNEPHAYISPTHYDKRESVPTWNYMAVHAYGKAKVITDDEAVLKILEQMIMNYEAGYLAQWRSLPDRYKAGIMKGIVPFEIEVSELQGQKKLSQNKTETERHRIVAGLSKSDNTVVQAIARHIAAL